jgi:hypothetical protein
MFITLYMVYALLMLLFSFWIFPLWTAMLIAWFGLALLILLSKQETKLNSKLKNTFLLVIIVYPLIASLIKFILLNDTIPYSWLWLNRIEHFLWATCFGILILPLIQLLTRNQSRIIAAICLIGLITVVGNLNEFVEYLIRDYLDLTKASYYEDTIIDMFINLLGSVFCFEITQLLDQNTKRNAPASNLPDSNEHC